MELHVGLGSDVAGGQTESIFRVMADAIQSSKLYWRHIDQNARPLTFHEAFYLAARGDGAFFGNAGSFEAGFDLDAAVLDDAKLLHPQRLSVRQRLERAVCLGLDANGIRAKFVAGNEIESKCLTGLSVPEREVNRM